MRTSYPGKVPASPAACYAIDTPLGPVGFTTRRGRLVEIRLGKRPRHVDADTELSRAARRQLAEYFAGRRTRFELPCALEAPGFTARVLRRVARIPFGRTLSYGELAAAIGAPRAARAVGNAVGSNPLPLLIPCHRVLATNAGLGGFGAGLAWKRGLLRLELVEWRETPTGRASRR